VIGLRKLSVVCGVMDRPCEAALDSWLARPEVDEVVIVDWSSRRPLWCYEPRVVVARARDQASWQASRCHNLGLSLATGDLILRLDADDVLGEDFFARQPYLYGSFYYADLKEARDDNETHLAGVVYALKEDFLRIGGYNERIEVYGYEDTDLVNRLVASGLHPLPLDFNTLHHLPHGDEARFANQSDAKFAELDEKLKHALSWSHSTLDKGSRAIVANKVLAESAPWTSGDKKSEWCYVRLQEGGPVRFFCWERFTS